MGRLSVNSSITVGGGNDSRLFMEKSPQWKNTKHQQHLDEIEGIPFPRWLTLRPATDLRKSPREVQSAHNANTCPESFQSHWK